MVEIYEGRIGSGKTYSAVYRIVCHLCMGGTVATNIALCWEGCCKLAANRFGVVLEPDQYVFLEDHQICDFHKHTPSGTGEMPVLVVLDEVHLNFNNRDFAQSDKAHRETFTFITQSRKVDTDVIFISQSMLNMDKQFARQVQFVWKFRNMAEWKIPGLGIKSPYKGILACQYDYDGRTLLERAFVSKDKGVFACYETKALLRKFPRLEGIKTVRKLAKAKGGANAQRWAFLGIGLMIWLVNLVMYLML